VILEFWGGQGEPHADGVNSPEHHQPAPPSYTQHALPAHSFLAFPLSPASLQQQFQCNVADPIALVRVVSRAHLMQPSRACEA
jgi:hypothetical protein